jgi:hypothetical protein
MRAPLFSSFSRLSREPAGNRMKTPAHDGVDRRNECRDDGSGSAKGFFVSLVLIDSRCGHPRHGHACGIPGPVACSA